MSGLKIHWMEREIDQQTSEFLSSSDEEITPTGSSDGSPPISPGGRSSSTAKKADDTEEHKGIGRPPASMKTRAVGKEIKHATEGLDTPPAVQPIMLN